MQIAASSDRRRHAEEPEARRGEAAARAAADARRSAARDRAAGHRLGGRWRRREGARGASKARRPARRSGKKAAAVDAAIVGIIDAVEYEHESELQRRRARARWCARRSRRVEPAQSPVDAAPVSLHGDVAPEPLPLRPSAVRRPVPHRARRAAAITAATASRTGTETTLVRVGHAFCSTTTAIPSVGSLAARRARHAMSIVYDGRDAIPREELKRRVAGQGRADLPCSPTRSTARCWTRRRR